MTQLRQDLSKTSVIQHDNIWPRGQEAIHTSSHHDIVNRTLTMGLVISVYQEAQSSATSV